MSGLDQILQRIEADAKAQAAAITEKAAAEAAAILADAKADGAARSAEIAERSAKDCASSKARIASSLEQQHRTALLRAKQDIIADMLEKSYETLRDMPADEYFPFLRRIFDRFALPEAGEILFSRKDLDRMPDGYLEELQAAAAARGGSLTLSRELREPDGGFILIYGGVEENCTLRALFEARREALQDQVHGLLFA